jgi:predicted ATPase
MLGELVTLEPASFAVGGSSDSNGSTLGQNVSLSVFLNFAISACDCLGLLHYGLETIHGEIRGDAFHFNQETGVVKLISIGNGARSFDNVLSKGWSSLSRELGVKNKLQFIAPEQTGRITTEPDCRTDIYALGVLFWTMLVGKPAFTGSDPIEVVQNVLGKKLPPISHKRMDIPDAVSAVIQKMTQKAVNERYHTISSVKRDLSQIAQLLSDGDSEALKDFQIAQRDVSSFFTLPSRMFGRCSESNKVIGVVEKVCQRQRQHSALAKAEAQNPSGLYAIGSNSPLSDGRVNSFEIASGSSDSGSFNIASRTNSNGGLCHLGHVSTHDSLSTESLLLKQQPAGLLSTKSKSPAHSHASWEHKDRDSNPSLGGNSQSHVDSLNSLPSHHAAPKFRRIGRCEVITVSGAAGIGKTDLLNRTQPAIRKLGYIAIAHLDRARRVPFEPFVKILASLLRQIFSERDVTTDYHNSVRAALRPIWPTLHRVLELPEHLISAGGKDRPSSPKISSAQQIPREWGRAEPFKRVGLPGLDHGQTSVDFFLANAASNNMRLMETFLDILRTLSQFKLICLCIDDLHYADDETLELIMNIVKAKLACVLILTSRKDELTSDPIKTLFETEGPNVTKIVLSPLVEEDLMQFVAATVHQDPNPALTQLAAFIQEKSLGNPYYVRMMLETCYSKKCIWYSWKNARWEFDLDRIFSEFEVPAYGEGLGTAFITRRLQETPSAARSILVWASLLGSPFSISLVQRLLTREFPYSSDSDETVDLSGPQIVDQYIVGLQYLVQAYIIIPGDTDGEFRFVLQSIIPCIHFLTNLDSFANDRLAQAVAHLKECCNVENMHFIISQTMMKYFHDVRSRYAMARHIALASRIIKSRVVHKLDYRKILWDAAQTASQSGARQSALWYFRHCLGLLQDNPWDDWGTDVYYDETLRLHVATAEMLWSQGHNPEALRVLDEVFDHGKTAVCKSRAWIVKAKIYAQAGNHLQAMNSLLTCLEELGVHLREPTTYDQCDAAYSRLKAYLDKADLEEIVHKPVSKDITMITIGTVMLEAMAVTHLADALTFYRMAIEMMNLHLFKGGFVQISIGCSHLAMISFSRFKDLELAARLSDTAVSLLERDPEAWTQNRGYTVHIFYISHLRVPLSSTLLALEASVEAAFSMGDPYITLITLSSMAMTRLYLGHDMTQVEAFCNESPEDIPDWMNDTRGGASLIAVR